MANITELDRVLAFIEAHPDNHEQAHYVSDESYLKDGKPVACGTTACFAGWTCVLNNRVKIRPSWNNEYIFTVAVGKLGYESSFSNEAAQILELDYTQEEALFHTARTLQDVRDTVDAIKSGDLYDEGPDDDDQESF